jgi:hypothetical protein
MTAISAREVGTTGVKVTMLGHLLHSFSLAPVSRFPRCAIGWCSTAAKEISGTARYLTPT